MESGRTEGGATSLDDPIRLAALRQTGLMDSKPDARFDRLTALAARLLGVPVSLVTLVDDQRQYIKSGVGLAVQETPLTHSFCKHVVLSAEPMIIPDAREDSRVAGNPAIRDYDVIAYAGIPLTNADGQTLGSFCAIDNVPRTWSADDIALLQELARGVVAQIALEDSNRELELQATQLSEAEQSTRRERDYNAAIIASMREGFLLTRDGTIIEVNDAFCVLTGFAHDELVGSRVPYPFWAPESAAEIQRHRKAVGGPTPRAMRTTYQCQDGSRIRVSVNTVVAKSRDGQPIGYVSTIVDIGEQEQREARLEHDASRDALTGLLNRRVFDQHLTAEIARAARLALPLSVVLLDLDHFKEVNDRHGHPVGDGVLREVASRLTRIVRAGEYIGRIGGEEFGWVLPGATAPGARAAAERARQAVGGTPFECAGTVTLSAGVCELDAEASDAASLYDHADQALYEAKRGGRDRVVVRTC